MSAVYGYVNNNMNVDISLKCIKKWNTPYGRDNQESIEKECFGIGCCYEKLTCNIAPKHVVISKNNKFFVIDSLIYNRDEIQKKYNNLVNLSDEEILISLIDGYGINSLKDVNGDFSGAIYNTDDKTLILFRDHMGIRPLYYYYDNNKVIFATDIRGILSIPTVDAQIDKDWFYKVMTGKSHLSVDRTEYENIKCVPVAGYIKFSLDDRSIRCEKGKYWELAQHKIRWKTEKQYCEGLRDIISDSVKRRAEVLSVPIGAELSGGLDSGVIDILLNRLGKEVTYFSWSYSPDVVPYAKQDERLVIDDICKQENITCNFRTMGDYLDEDSAYSKELKTLGYCFSDDEVGIMDMALPPYMNTLNICMTAQFLRQNGARVVFTGHGGDEGVSHRSNPYEMYYNHEYYHYLRYMWSTTNGKKHRIKNTIKNTSNSIRMISKRFKEEMNEPFCAISLVRNEFLQGCNNDSMPFYFAYDPVSYVKNGGSRNRLDVVALFGAYNNVRYIVPFLDYRVIDYALSIPRHMYLKPTNTRYIYREAFKDIMPKSMYNLRVKKDASYDNVPKQEKDWYEEHERDKQSVVARLDREYWKDYLDFDAIDKWVNSGRPSDEKRSESEANVICLIQCALASTAVSAARSLNKDN